MQKKSSHQKSSPHPAGPSGGNPSSTPPKPSPSIDPPLTRREQFLFAAILLCGATARLRALAHSAVEHFDEGIYASNLYFGAPNYAYPLQRYYAPPLLPALIETGMILGFPPNVAALLPSLLAGCGTIAAVWWFGRSWFGPAAGLSAAALIAFSDFHILLSTAALTDALLGLWLVLAVDAIARSFARDDYRWAIAAGLYTGLSWWTKYNGWLPLAIASAALPVLVWALRPSWQRLQTWLACVTITTVLAALVWSPYFLSLQNSGGYAPIAANHARYVVGLSGWYDSAFRQLSNQALLEGPLAKIGLLIAIWIPLLWTRRNRLNRITLAAMFAATLAIAILLTTVLSLLVFAAAAFIQAVLLRWSSPASSELRNAQTVPLELLFAWCAGMLVSTPFYSAYPRLLLPGWLAACLATAVYWSTFWIANPASAEHSVRHAARHRDSVASPISLPHRWPHPQIDGLMLAGLLFALLLLGAVTIRDQRRLQASNATHTQSQRDGIAIAAEQIRQAVSASEPRVFYVLGEPALLFQLRAAGEQLVAPVQQLPSEPFQIDGSPVPTFLLAGPHAFRDPEISAQLAGASDRWKNVQSFAYRPSLLVWLDLFDPRQPLFNFHPSNAVQLYQYQSAANSSPTP